MGGEAKETYIPDADGADRSLAAMAAHAEVLEEKIKGIVAKITQHEGGKPWGTAPEYGGQFENAYHAGKGGGAGAQFVKDNVTIIGTETRDGVTVAHEALRGSVDLDKVIAGAFKVDGSDDVGKQMKGTLDALSQPADGGSA